MIMPMLAFGQSSSKKGAWSSSDMKTCILEGIEEIENDSEMMQGLNQFETNIKDFVDCICDTLEDQYNSYYEAELETDNLSDEEAGLMILHCLLGYVDLEELGQCISGDCENGYGTYVDENGDKYIGEFKNGKYHGIGTLLGKWEGEANTWGYDNGEWIYIGQFQGGLYHGFGQYYFNGSDGFNIFREMGDWQFGKKNGKIMTQYPGGEDGHVMRYINNLYQSVICEF